ncbi:MULTISPECIES: hypothetical protein [Corallococcus]|uniref:hypothetical protein n=1 Tax=Corallococcus TaxID=83461 RepID=UPI0013152201|nr:MULTISPECIES: hypothetical protein [Corallococcus]
MTLKAIHRPVLVSSLILFAGLAWAGEPRGSPASARAVMTDTCTDLPVDLAQAAQVAKLPISTEEIATATAGSSALAAAPAVGLEEVPATRYAQGVDVGFVYVNVPDSAVPAGVYRIPCLRQGE